MAAFEFKKAVKFDAKGRIALIGPAGSGKSMTALRAARLLAGPDGRVAAIDSEHGSLSKYAVSPGEQPDNLFTFDFDVNEFDTFSLNNWMAAHDAAEAAGYSVFITDSLSHFWMGPGGALEFVDAALNSAKRRSSSGRADDMVGWKEFRPHERAMVDRMIASKMHIICTMRTKTEYQMVEKNGRSVRQKVGLAPVQREGLDYEFDLVCTLDDENSLFTDKTRCPYYGGKVIQKPAGKDFEPFRDWLKGVSREQQPKAQAQQPKPAASAPAAAPPAAAPPPAATPAVQAESGRRQATPAQRPTTSAAQKGELPHAADPLVEQIVAAKKANGDAGKAAEMQKVFDEFAISFTRKHGGDGNAALVEYEAILHAHGVKDPAECKNVGELRTLIRAFHDAATIPLEARAA